MSLESILDDNFGLIKVNAAFEVNDDHFNRNDDPNIDYRLGLDHESSIKFLLFVKSREYTKA